MSTEFTNEFRGRVWHLFEKKNLRYRSQLPCQPIIVNGGNIRGRIIGFVPLGTDGVVKTIYLSWINDQHKIVIDGKDYDVPEDLMPVINETNIMPRGIRS